MDEKHAPWRCKGTATRDDSAVSDFHEAWGVPEGEFQIRGTNETHSFALVHICIKGPMTGYASTIRPGSLQPEHTPKSQASAYSVMMAGERVRARAAPPPFILREVMMAVENIDAKSLGELLRFVGDDEARMEMLNSEMAIEVPANLLVETKGFSEAQKSFAGLYTPLVYLFRVVASQGIRRRHREIYNLTKLLLEARADPQVLTSTTIFTPINRHQAAGKHTTHTALHLLMSPDDTCVVSFNLDGEN
eukprot:1392022-Amorphochlora_amoeboformis.AAC.1